jgi:imidazolonepropionase-like amidohydrolase
MNQYFGLIVFFLFSHFCFGQNILITDINIVNVESGTIDTEQNILIENGKISMISSSLPKGKEVDLTVDGSDKYIIPGLSEMHAHIPPPTASKQRVEDVLFLYLSNGITLIRGMLGDSIHLELREKAETGGLLSPRIFTSSPSLNGGTVRTIEEAREKVSKYKADGYDFLKIHPGIQREVFDQVVSTANEVGITFAGHVPVDVGIRHALESGYASIDHVDGFMEGLVPENENVKPDANGFFGYNFAPLADQQKIDELVSLSRVHEVWIVPTQSLFERWFAPVSAQELLSQPEMKYMPAATRRNWLRIKNQYMEDETFNKEQWEQFNAIRLELIKSLSDSGHGILMGSDAPQLFNVPGFSIQHEINGMQNAGMSNLEILQSGTINPAKFFGLEDQIGQVKVGYSAELLIVNQNPLEDLDALQNIEGVFRRGQWISKSDIDQRLEEIAARCSE